jgi:hypothetical protein
LDNLIEHMISQGEEKINHWTKNKWDRIKAYPYLFIVTLGGYIDGWNTYNYFIVYFVTYLCISIWC